MAEGLSRKGVKLGADGLLEVFPGPPGKIRPSHGALKKNVPHDDGFAFSIVEDDMTRSMARAMENFEGGFPHLQLHPLVEVSIRFGRFHPPPPVEVGLLG